MQWHATCRKKTMENLIEATILTGPYEGEAVLIPRFPMIPTDQRILATFDDKLQLYPLRYRKVLLTLILL